jgi:hypothetical protein
MIVAIQGTKGFTDYAVFLRGIGNALRDRPEDDKEFTIMSAGPVNINQFALEFTNISERSLKAHGVRIKLVKVPPTWIRDNIHSVNYFLFFSKPKESLSDLVSIAEAKSIEVGVYRY